MDDPVKIVEEYLRIHMIPDPATAKRLYCAPEMEIRFTGNRLMHDQPRRPPSTRPATSG